MSNLNSVLEKLQGINNNETFPVYIHALEKDVQFKPLTAKHEKEILKVFSTPMNAYKEAPKYLHTLVHELCEDKSLEFSQLEVANILLYIRKFSSGDLYHDDESNTDVNISDVIERNRSFKFSKKELSSEITVKVGDNTFIITIQIPENISKEQIYYDFIKNSNVDSIEDAQTKWFSVEMVKVLKQIVIKNNSDEDFIINMDNIPSVKQKIQVYESLTSKVTQEIREKIKEMKEFERKCLTYEGKNIKLDQNFLINKK